MKRNQVKDAHDLYDVRAKTYDASFHKRFSSHIVQLANPQPGESVLDLACGTGLVTCNTSNLVGKSRYVTGIDVSTGMLAEARAELQAHPFGNVQLVHHSITDLGSLHELGGRLFDVITCASALVLLPQPEAALSQWMKYLRPCSRFIIDATHPRALLPGMVLERVGRRLDLPVPSYRDAFKQPKYLATMMQAAGMTRTTLTRMSQLSSRDGSHDLQAFVLSDDDEPRRPQPILSTMQDLFSTLK
ncbi:hypothetical protein WHR41_04685 [Cladosporium halotolerans]|uniref:Methyltransferase domain-containing protein n=1 Tax=Cladosporium halotolerans TaxID=1052096 RepID=A0AB34KNY9_9PEZI